MGKILEEILELLSKAFTRIEELEDAVTELQVFLYGEGILPGVHYFNESEHIPEQSEEES